MLRKWDAIAIIVVSVVVGGIYLSSGGGGSIVQTIRTVTTIEPPDPNIKRIGRKSHSYSESDGYHLFAEDGSYLEVSKIRHSATEVGDVVRSEQWLNPDKIVVQKMKPPEKSGSRY